MSVSFLGDGVIIDMQSKSIRWWILNTRGYTLGDSRIGVIDDDWWELLWPI